MKLVRRIVAGLLLVVALLVGGSAAYEAAYCAGWSQGTSDGLGFFYGPAPQEFVDEIRAACSDAPNDPVPMGLPRFFTGNLFDSLRDKLPW